jgi:hypothetical protein
VKKAIGGGSSLGTRGLCGAEQQALLPFSLLLLLLHAQDLLIVSDKRLVFR